MKKIFLFVFVFFFFGFSVVFAEDQIKIVCNKSQNCFNESGLPIFNEENIYPGFSINKKITIFNKTESICDLNLKLSRENKNNKLAEKILLGIDKKNYSLNKILNGKEINLGKVKSNSLKIFNFSYVLDNKIGNEFKNQKIDFDINFNFSCENIQEKILGAMSNKQPAENYLPAVLFFLLALLSLITFILLLRKSLSNKV